MGHILCLALIVLGTFLHAEQRPNIIVILSDDGGYQDFGAYGGKNVPTPNIDELARNGVLFTNAYATASVCAPSRAGLLTGKYQQRFGFEHNISDLPAKGYKQEDIGLDKTVKTIAEHMRYNGYKTIALGKWHQGDYPQYHPLKRGFDHFYGFIGGHRSYYGIPAQKQKVLFELHDDDTIAPEDSIEYLTASLTNKAIDYIHTYKETPFFMYLAFNAIHTPMQATYRSFEKHENEKDTLRRTYLAMLDDMDAGIGQIVAHLKQAGLYENTLILFMNDNGAATNNGADNGILRGLKGSKWEGGIRVPFIMQWPNRLPKNVISTTLVSTMDVLPTAIAAANGDLLPQQTTDGIDLLTSYNSANKGHDYLFWRRGVAKAVRYKQWKLIIAGDNPVLLFDLNKDPKEESNIASRYPKMAAKLKKELAAWEKQMQSPRWFSAYGDKNQIMKHRMEVLGREMEKLYP